MCAATQHLTETASTVRIIVFRKLLNGFWQQIFIRHQMSPFYRFGGRGWHPKRLVRVGRVHCLGQSPKKEIQFRIGTARYLLFFVCCENLRYFNIGGHEDVQMVVQEVINEKLKVFLKIHCKSVMSLCCLKNAHNSDKTIFAVKHLFQTRGFFILDLDLNFSFQICR